MSSTSFPLSHTIKETACTNCTSEACGHAAAPQDKTPCTTTTTTTTFESLLHVGSVTSQAVTFAVSSLLVCTCPVSVTLLVTLSSATTAPKACFLQPVGAGKKASQKTQQSSRISPIGCDQCKIQSHTQQRHEQQLDRWLSIRI
jgi:hypothetical protein